MRKDSVDPSAHTSKLGHGALLNAHPTGKIFIAVEEASCAVKSVSEIEFDWIIALEKAKSIVKKHV